MEIPFSIAILKAYHAQSNVIRPLMAEIGLSMGQPKILDFLIHHEGCMQKELAALCDIEPATISRILDKMEADGMITRTIATANKRAAVISLTPRGRQLQDQMRQIRGKVERQELSGFTKEEQEQFSAYLKRLYANLTTAQDSE